MTGPQMHVPTEEEQAALKALATQRAMETTAGIARETGIAEISAMCLMFMASLKLLATLGGPASRHYAVACMDGCFGTLDEKKKAAHRKRAMKATEDMAAYYEAIPDNLGRMQ